MYGILKSATAAQPLISAESFMAREDFRALDVLNADTILVADQIGSGADACGSRPWRCGFCRMRDLGWSCCWRHGERGDRDGQRSRERSSSREPRQGPSSRLFVGDAAFSKMQAHAEAHMHVACNGASLAICAVRCASVHSWNGRRGPPLVMSEAHVPSC